MTTDDYAELLDRDVDSLLAEAAAVCEVIAEHARQADARRADRRRLWLAANRVGARYLAIAESCDVTDALVAKDIKRARSEYPALDRPVNRSARAAETRARNRDDDGG